MQREAVAELVTRDMRDERRRRVRAIEKSRRHRRRDHDGAGRARIRRDDRGELLTRAR
jgi:hypothetical protein